MITRSEALEILDRAVRVLREADRVLRLPGNMRRFTHSKDQLANLGEFTRIRFEAEKIIEEIRARIIGV